MISLCSMDNDWVSFVNLTVKLKMTFICGISYVRLFLSKLDTVIDYHNPTWSPDFVTPVR